MVKAVYVFELSVNYPFIVKAVIIGGGGLTSLTNGHYREGESKVSCRVWSKT